MSLVNADIAASLAESARVINSPQTLEETLDAIVRATLVSASQVKIRDIAHEIINTTNADHQPTTRD